MPLPYNEGIKANCRFLEQVKQSSADEFIVRAVQLQRLKEEIVGVFAYDNPGARSLNVDTVQMTINSYARELEAMQALDPVQDKFFACKKSTSKTAGTEANLAAALVELSTRHTWICLYEVALQMRPTSRDTPSAKSDEETIEHATRRTNLLIRCLEKAKAYSDYTARQPNAYLELHTSIHRCQLAHVAIVMFKLCFNTTNGTPQNPTPLRKACNMMYYFNNLTDACKDHDRAKCDGQCASRDRISHFRDKVGRLKAWYERLEAFDGLGGDDSLENMSTLNLENIEKQEQQMFELDWSMMDFTNMDMTSLWN